MVASGLHGLSGIFYKTKSRIRWLTLGDANTTFYYKSVITHQARNSIRYLMDGDNQRVDQTEEIISLAEDYLKVLLNQENSEVQPYTVSELRTMIPYRFPQEWVKDFVSIPPSEEITEFIFGMPNSKAPNPDGFRLSSFRKPGQSSGLTLATVQEFFARRRMLKSLTLLL